MTDRATGANSVYFLSRIQTQVSRVLRLIHIMLAKLIGPGVVVLLFSKEKSWGRGNPIHRQRLDQPCLNIKLEETIPRVMMITAEQYVQETFMLVHNSRLYPYWWNTNHRWPIQHPFHFQSIVGLPWLYWLCNGERCFLDRTASWNLRSPGQLEEIDKENLIKEGGKYFCFLSTELGGLMTSGRSR